MNIVVRSELRTVWVASALPEWHPSARISHVIRMEIPRMEIDSNVKVRTNSAKNRIFDFDIAT